MTKKLQSLFFVVIETLNSDHSEYSLLYSLWTVTSQTQTSVIRSQNQQQSNSIYENSPLFPTVVST